MIFSMFADSYSASHTNYLKMKKMMGYISYIVHAITCHILYNILLFCLRAILLLRFFLYKEIIKKKTMLSRTMAYTRFRYYHN